ncbi:MAG: 5-methyltetrahydrofolate--homocysteine methyltransferase, partial [Erysipelotrichaceae bacterium]
NLKNILECLGINNKDMVDDKLLKDIANISKETLGVIKPRYTYKEYELIEGQLANKEIILEGEDIQRLLKESHHVIFIAMTLGIEIDRVIQKYQIKDMAKAVILDASASAAIEEYANNIQEELEIQYAKKDMFITERYSCGYGDLPLEMQGKFIEVIGANKAIGLYADKSNLLNPRKSITAIIGISNKEQGKMLSGCSNCKLKDSCIYKKGGNKCEK